MERVLRSEEMAEIIFLPIRHHSPACAWHVSQVIGEKRPDMVLIEGPCNAQELIGVMLEEETKAPFAVYYSYRDKDAVLSEEKSHYRCYYPFLDYSPELSAMRAGKQAGAQLSFIDLAYGEILAASAADASEKLVYNDDRLLSKNRYWEKICEKTGLRSFDEFWEKYFEIDGIHEDSESWFQKLLSYCRLAREETAEEELRKDGCQAREAFMAEQILRAARENAGKSILVVTGGFHTPGLLGLIHDAEESGHCKDLERKADNPIHKRMQKVPKKDQEVYLMPYSLEAADAMNGYASGMPFPGFYQQVWEALLTKELPFQEAVYDMLVSAGKQARTRDLTVTTYDEICACSMADGLAALRNKKEPGAYELLDSALSSFIKGEYTFATDEPMRILKKRMTGKKIGKLSQTAKRPPILQDFENQCVQYGIRFRTTMEMEVTLHIFSSQKHRSMSSFFHRMTFLESSFCKRVKGPNLQTMRDRNLIREIWKYRWSAQVDSALIDVSVYGATLEEAACSLAEERLSGAFGASEGAKLLSQMFEMDLKEQQKSACEKMQDLIFRDADFYSLAEALEHLMRLEQLKALYRSEMELKKIISDCAWKLIRLLPSMAAVKDEDLEKCMNACKLLYQISGKDSLFSQEQYLEALENALSEPDIHPGLEGCIHGLLYGALKRSVRQVEAVCQGYLTGTKEQAKKTAQYLRGLFSSAKDLVFSGEAFVEMIDRFLGAVQEKDFMDLLPELRIAFSYFTPGEIDLIAQKAAALHGKKKDAITEVEGVPADWYAYGKELDDYAGEVI